MENYNDIKKIFTKYLDNSISKDEYDRLLQYFGKKEGSEELHQLVMEALANETNEYDNVQLGRVVDRVAAQLRGKLQPKKTILLRKYMPYAAAALLFFMIGISYYIIFRKDNQREKEVAVIDVKPGKSAATLTLADGKKILLNNISAGNITSDRGITVSKAKGGELIYTIKESNTNLPTDINTLSTANGETYQIMLSDGTKVWLNAATTLQYSANLRTQGKRKVKLIAGEAYFEVTKDKNHPFIVETSSQDVEVLGTHFNINSYLDEGHTVTTLEEGSVRVLPLNTISEGNKIILKPGQQSINAKSGIEVREADLETALAWKEGEIYFRHASIQEVLRQVSRWYNIEVKYLGTPTKELFNGGIKRNSNLSTVLRILELSDVHFSLMKKNNITTLIVQ